MKNTVKTVGIVMIIMLCGKISGLARDIALNAVMGTESAVRTAFDPALTIPSQFLDFAFSAALSSSFIPIFNEVLQKSGKKSAFALANKFITVVLILTVVFTGVMIVFAPSIINVFAGGITDVSTKRMAVDLIRLMFPTVVLTAAAFSLTGVLQSLGEFNVPAAMSLLSNVVIIGYFLVFYNRFGVVGLCVAFLAGWCTQIVIQVGPLRKRGYSYRPNFAFFDKDLVAIGKMTLPVLVSTWIIPVNTLVNKRAASGLFDGAGMNALTTANSLYSVVTGVFILSVTNVMFPKMARETAKGDKGAFVETVYSTLSAAIYFILPISAILFALAEPVTRLMFERGAFTDVSTQRTAAALQEFALGMIGLAVQTVLCRAFYAEKDAKTPFWAAVAAMVINGVLSGYLTKMLEIKGTALASSASVTVAGAVMMVVFVRRYKSALTAVLGKAFGKSFVAALIVAVCVGFVNKVLPFNRGFLAEGANVVVSTMVGVVVYIATTFLLKVKEAKVVVDFLAKVVKNVRN